MRKFIKPIAILMMSISLTGGMAYVMTPEPPKEKTPVSEVLKVTDTPKVETKVAEEPVAEKAPVVAPVLNNETIAWNYFISQGFTREQTAGIMGNLQQEHNFKTEQADGGLGIAQWINGRADRLEEIPGYEGLQTQLDYMTQELQGTHKSANTAVRGSTTVEGATVAFQDLYEVCGDCRTPTRIQYAYDILGRH